MADFGEARLDNYGIAVDMDLIQFVDVASNVIRSALNRNCTKPKRRVNHRRFLQKQVRRYQAENGVSALITCTPSRTRAKTSKSNRTNHLQVEDATLLQVVPEFSSGSPSELSRADTNSTAPSECSFTESCDAPMCESWEALLTPIDYHNMPLPPTSSSAHGHNQYLTYPETLYHPEAPEENWGWMPSQPDQCYPSSAEWVSSDVQAVPEFTDTFRDPQSIRELLEQPKRASDQAVRQAQSDNLGSAVTDAGWIAEVFQQHNFANEFSEWYNELETEASSIYPNAMPSSVNTWDTVSSASGNVHHPDFSRFTCEDLQQQFNPINDDISFTELVLTNFNPAYRDQRASSDAYC